MDKFLRPFSSKRPKAERWSSFLIKPIVFFRGLNLYVHFVLMFGFF